MCLERGYGIPHCIIVVTHQDDEWQSLTQVHHYLKLHSKKVGHIIFILPDAFLTTIRSLGVQLSSYCGSARLLSSLSQNTYTLAEETMTQPFIERNIIYSFLSP